MLGFQLLIKLTQAYIETDENYELCNRHKKLPEFTFTAYCYPRGLLRSPAWQFKPNCGGCLKIIVLLYHLNSYSKIRRG